MPRSYGGGGGGGGNLYSVQVGLDAPPVDDAYDEAQEDAPFDPHLLLKTPTSQEWSKVRERDREREIVCVQKGICERE
jgi:hypothetical protein